MLQNWTEVWNSFCISIMGKHKLRSFAHKFAILAYKMTTLVSCCDSLISKQPVALLCYIEQFSVWAGISVFNFLCKKKTNRSLEHSGGRSGVASVCGLDSAGTWTSLFGSICSIVLSWWTLPPAQLRKSSSFFGNELRDTLNGLKRENGRELLWPLHYRRPAVWLWDSDLMIEVLHPPGWWPDMWKNQRHFRKLLLKTIW